MTNDEIVAVVTAYSAGRLIACRKRGTDNSWINVKDPAWSFNTHDYKIAYRECWMNIYPSGNSLLHSSKEEADASATTNRINCIHLVEEN